MENNKQQTADFSQAAVKKAVLKNTLQHPSVLYPGAVGILSGFAALLMGPTGLLVGLAGAGLGLSALGWGVNFGLRRDAFANAYVQYIRDRMEKHRREKTQKIEKQLKHLDSENGVRQFNAMREKYATLQSLLDRKLNAGELTHGRYLGVAEQVYLATLDNLNKIILTLDGSKAIDEKFVLGRIKELQGSTDLTQNQQRELQALNTRLELYQSQIELVEQLHTKNEEAMTQMDVTIAAIAAMDTNQGQASIDLEMAMNELDLLAKRASKY